MSETAVTPGKKLQVEGIIKSGIDISMSNLGPILVNTLLYIVTVWIPYINIGTTIGMISGIIVKAGKKEPIAMTEIFNPVYRKYMGEFFLTSGLIAAGVGMGLAFFLIPGYVIAIAWSQALLLAIDKGKNPTEAISLSNKITYGYKKDIFLASLVLCIAASIAGGLLALIPFIGFLFAFAVVVFAMFVAIGMQAYIYKTLSADI
jgi:uncharacterized membrane protein